jgi:hypothetical protein
MPTRTDRASRIRVVIDPAVDAAAAGVGEAAPEALDLRGVDDDGGVEAGVGGDDVDDAVAAGEPRERRRVGLVVVDHDVTAEAPQRAGQRQGRAGDVAIGARVAADEDALRRREDGGDGLGLIAGAVGQFAGVAAEGFAGAVHGNGAYRVRRRTARPASFRKYRRINRLVRGGGGA